MNIRCSIESESGNFIIIDDNEKMITEISKEAIIKIYNMKYITNPSVEINCNDAINFYNEFIEIALENKSTNDKNNNYFKSHIFSSDIN